MSDTSPIASNPTSVTFDTNTVDLSKIEPVLKAAIINSINTTVTNVTAAVKSAANHVALAEKSLQDKIVATTSAHLASVKADADALLSKLNAGVAVVEAVSPPFVSTAITDVKNAGVWLATEAKALETDAGNELAALRADVAALATKLGTTTIWTYVALGFFGVGGAMVGAAIMKFLF